MSEADRIWEELDITFSRWGLREIPFTESASTLSLTQLREVFTGRTEELKHVLNLFRGRERKRMLIYGWVGIGKTAFILEVLGVLQRKAKDSLTAYISLPPDMDLATAALIALAREMEDDEWAQHQLNQMGLRPKQPVRKRKGKIKAGISFTLEDLERIRVKEFSEILPILEKLVQLDLVRRLPTERAAEYKPTPMLSGQHESLAETRESNED